ncbi:hypothetical protein AB9F41_37055, partial [Rhizobium leguminosarum]
PLDHSLCPGHALVQRLAALCDSAGDQIGAQMRGDALEAAALVDGIELEAQAAALAARLKGCMNRQMDQRRQSVRALMRAL